MKTIDQVQIDDNVEFRKSVSVASTVTGPTGKPARKAKYEFHRLTKPGQIMELNAKEYGASDFLKFAKNVETTARNFGKQHNARYLFAPIREQNKILVKLDKINPQD